jgi:hypothetical protein
MAIKEKYLKEKNGPKLKKYERNEKSKSYSFSDDSND